MKSSSLRTFVSEIIDKIDSSDEFRDFHSLKESVKNEKFIALIKSLNNPILQLYSSYHFRNFIGDMCSDLKYNMKKTVSLEENLGLFLVFDSFTSSKAGEISFDFMEKTPLYRTLQFLYKSLVNNEDNVGYVLNIQDLLIPMLDFSDGFFREIDSLKFESSIAQEVADLGQLFFKCLKLFFSLKSFAAWKLLISKQKTQSFLQFYRMRFSQFPDVKMPLIETFEFLTTAERKNVEFLKDAIFSENEFLIELWRNSLNIETLVDFELVITLFRLASFLGCFPLDYFSYSRFLKRLRSFLSSMLRKETKNKAKVFKIITPKIFSLTLISVKIMGKSHENIALEKVFNKEIANLNKIVYLPEVFETLMGFLEELTDYPDLNKEILFIIELFFNEILGLLSQNDWNFAIIKENDYDILKKLIKVIGKSREPSYNKQLLELILYIFTVFSRKSEVSNAVISDLLEIFKILRVEECEETRRIVLITLEKILEFFKSDFGAQEIELFWNLCDILLDFARREDDSVPKSTGLKGRKARPSVESLINLIKIVLKKNKTFLIEIKNNSFFQDLVISLDYRCLEFVGLMLFLLKEELNFKPNSLHIYCESIVNVIDRCFRELNLEKLHCLLILLRRAFSSECQGFIKVFTEVFLENGRILEKILNGYQSLRKNQENCGIFLGFIREFIGDSPFFRSYFEKNPHLLRSSIFSKLSENKEYIGKILTFSYFCEEDEEEKQEEFAFFPRNATLVFATMIPWVFESQILDYSSELPSFLKELKAITQFNESNSRNLLKSEFFTVLLEKPHDFVAETLDLLFSVLRNTSARVPSANSAILFVKCLENPALNDKNRGIFLKGLKELLEKSRFSPSNLPVSSSLSAKIAIPRIRFPENGNLSLFGWFRLDNLSQKTELSDNNEVNLLEISSFGESYFRIFKRDANILLSFLNYPETVLENTLLPINEWFFLGLVLSKNKEVFSIDLYLNGFPTDTRFYILEKPLELMFKMLAIEVSGGLEKLELASLLGFKRNLSRNQALLLYLCQDDGGFCVSGEVNEEFMRQNEGRSLDFSGFSKGIRNRELKVRNGNGGHPIGQSQGEDSGMGLARNLRRDGFFCNPDDLYEDLTICLETRNCISLKKNEGLTRTFVDDLSLDKSKETNISVIINSAFEVTANYMNKAAEWLHGLYITESSSTNARDDPSALSPNRDFSLRNVLFETGFSERLLSSFVESKREFLFFQVFIELFRGCKLMQRELACPESELKGFLREAMRKSAWLLKIDEVFELFSVNGRIRSSGFLLEFLWNKGFLMSLNKGQRKLAFGLVLSKLLNENNPFFEFNLAVLREGDFIEILQRILFKAEISEGCELEMIKILYPLIGSSKSRMDETALRALKSIVNNCFLYHFKSETLDKLIQKADFSLISQKKLDNLLEICLEMAEKLQLSEDKSSFELNPEFFLRVISMRGSNALISLISNTENAANIARFLVRNLLISMRNTNFSIDFSTLPVMIRTLQPLFGDPALVSRDILKTFKEETKVGFNIFLLNLFLKGFEILGYLQSSCQLLEKGDELAKILNSKGSFSNKDLSFLNELLKKSQSSSDFVPLQVIPELQTFVSNFFETLDFFRSKDPSQPEKPLSFPLYENLFKVLSKIMMFNTSGFLPVEKSRTHVFEIIAGVLTNLLKKPTNESLFQMDKLVIQLQREISEDLTIVLLNKVIDNSLMANDDEFFANYQSFAMFVSKFSKKIIRRNRKSELKNTLEFSILIMRRRDFLEASRKKPRESFIKTLFQKSTEKTPILEFESLSTNSKFIIFSILKTLVFESKDEKELRSFFSFIGENCEFFFEGKYERDDFTVVFLHFLYEGIRSLQFTSQTREILVDFMLQISHSYKNSFRRVLKTNFSSDATDKILEALNEKSLMPDPFVERIKGIIKTEGIFQAEYLAFLGNLMKSVKDELNNPLIFTSEMKFYESNKEIPSKSEDLLVASNSLHNAPSLHFLLNTAEFQVSFREIIEKNLKNAAVSERLNLVSDFAKVKEKSLFFQKKLEKMTFFDQNFKAKDIRYTFSHSKKGLSYEKKLVYLKKTPDFVAKEQLSAKLKSPLLESFLKTSQVKNKGELIKQPDSSTSSEDEIETTELSLEIESIEKKSNSQIKSPALPRKYSQKSAFFLTFLEEFGISNEEYVDDCFEVAYLKEREAFIDAVLLICKESIILLLGFYLNEWGLPQEVTAEVHLEKSRFLRKRSRDVAGTFPENPGLHEYSFDRINGYKRIIRIPKWEIREMHMKRYWLKPTAIELFTNRKAFFLIFNLLERETAYKKIIQGICGGTGAKVAYKKHHLLFTLFYLAKSQGKKRRVMHKTFTSHTLVKLLTPLWKKGLINNFEYLILLNTIAGRTYSDLSQYPVFPWVLSNYNSKYDSLDLLEKSNFRELSRPIGALTEERVKLAKEKYESTSEEKNLFPAFHYGSHYSSAVLVLYYLVRLMPYSKYAINLQGGHFDLSDRLFSNFSDTWTLANNLDYKELIPEVYYLPEFVLNVNNFDFGKTQTDILVRDIILPLWSRFEPRFFTKFNRKALESVLSSQNLNHWIDLIFGFKQKGQAAVDALNLFYFLTYEDEVDLDVYTDPLEKSAILDQINEYGQTPKQLFKKRHPKRKLLEKNVFMAYDLKQLMNLKANLYYDDGMNSSQRKLSEIYGKNDDFLSTRRNSMLESSGIRSSRVFSSFLTKILEQGPTVTSKGNLMHLKTLAKKLIEKQEKHPDIIFMNYKGQSLISVKPIEGSENTLKKKIFNWNNAYNCVLMISQTEKGAEKSLENEILAVFKPEIGEVSSSLYWNMNKSLFLGTKTGMIAIYEYKKDFETASVRGTGHKKSRDEKSLMLNATSSAGLRPSASNAANAKKTLNMTLFLDRTDLGLIFKQSAFYQLNEKKIYIVKKGDYSSMRSESSSFMPSISNATVQRESVGINKEGRESKFNLSLPGFNEEVTKKTRTLELRNLLKGAHFSEITHIKQIKAYLLLLSADKDGIIAFWDMQKCSLIRKLANHHYQDLRVYEFQVLNKKQANLENTPKSLLKRQTIKSLSICQETGDFLVISRNYVSVYSLNGVLMAIEQMKEQHFSCGLITTNCCPSAFEECYVITGHKTGIISFWVMKPTENHDKMGSFNRNTEHYSNKFEMSPFLTTINVPYRLHCIYKLFTSEYSILFEEGLNNDYQFQQQLTIERMDLSNDQKKLYTYHRNKKVLCWKFEENDLNSLKKCVNCGTAFGLLDKKNGCPLCGLNMCVPCSKLSRIVPEVSLKEAAKVCEKCFKRESERRLISLYDNY